MSSALPFIAAAVAQVLGAIVRRLSGSITAAHFQQLEKSELVLPADASVPPHHRTRRTAGEILPSGYSAAAIAAVSSKNAEGANVLVGGVTLAAAALGLGIVPSGITTLAILLSFVVTIAIAIRLWTMGYERFAERRWFGISRVSVCLALLNLLLAGLVAVLNP